jgi:hypothetical protein
VSAAITFIAVIISLVVIRVPKLAPGEKLDTSPLTVG